MTYRIKAIWQLYGGYEVGIQVVMAYQEVQRDEETRQTGYKVHHPGYEDPRDLPVGVCLRG